jgi:hypothetical protein
MVPEQLSQPHVSSDPSPPSPPPNRYTLPNSKTLGPTAQRIHVSTEAAELYRWPNRDKITLKAIARICAYCKFVLEKLWKTGSFNKTKYDTHAKFYDMARTDIVFRAKVVHLAQTYIQKRIDGSAQGLRFNTSTDLDIAGAAEELCVRLITKTVTMRSADLDLVPSTMFFAKFGKTPAAAGLREVTIGRVTGVLKPAVGAQPAWGTFRITSTEAFAAVRQQAPFAVTCN